MFSTISSIYDPLGIPAPFVLNGCQILQRLCQLTVGWDEKVLNSLQNEWIHWRSKLPGLENIKTNKCYKPENFRSIVKAEVHHFSYVSEDGYGQCSHLRIIDQFGVIHCSLLIGKSRVRPIKFILIPSLELTVATLSIKMSKLIRNVLEIGDFEETHWTGSRVVLGYIENEVKRFKIFVVKRIQIIKENSNVNQWKYVSTKSNPINDDSRGLNATNINKITGWFSCPEFLWEPEAEWDIDTNFEAPDS